MQGVTSPATPRPLTSGLCSGKCLLHVLVLLIFLQGIGGRIPQLLLGSECVSFDPEFTVQLSCNGPLLNVAFWITVLWPVLIFVVFPMVYYRFSGSARQLLYVIFEAMLLCTPMLIVTQLFLVPVALGLNPVFQRFLSNLSQGIPPTQMSPLEFACNFLGHLMVAALPEETLKYIAIRRVLFSSRAADANAVVLYGLGAGFGFSLFENVLYAAAAGQVQGGAGMLVEAVERMPIVGMHCAAGVLTASALARAKFLGAPHSRRYANVVWEAMLYHALFNGSTAQSPFWITIKVVIWFGGYLYARWRLVGLDTVALVNYQECLNKGLVAPPACLCEDGRITTPETQRASFESRARLSFVSRVLDGEASPDSLGVISEPVRCESCGAMVNRHKILPSICPRCLSSLALPGPQAPAVQMAAVA